MMPGILALAEDLVAALAGVAGARDRDRAAEQRGRHVVKILEVANAGHVLGEKIDRDRALQRQIVQVVVDDHRRIAADDVLRQGFMSRAAAVHHHPGVRAGAVQDAVLDEMAGVVQHAGIGGFAGIDLGDVAGGRVIQDGGGMRPDQVAASSGPTHPSGPPWCGSPRDPGRRPSNRSTPSPCRSNLRASIPVPGAGRPEPRYAS